MDSGNRFHQRRFVFRARNALEFRPQRLQSPGLDGLFVHAGTVVVTDFLADGIATRIVGSGFFQNLPHDAHIPLTKFDEARPGSLVRRNFRRLQPVGASVLGEVLTRIEGLIDRIEIDGWLGQSRLCETADDHQQKRFWHKIK